MVDGIKLNIVPDSGASVNAAVPSGNINLTGYPLGAGSIKGIKTFNPGSPVNTFQLSNLRDLSPYVVGQSSNYSQYTSIQAAINQAATDGAASGGEKSIIILPGTYTENVTLHPWVNLVAVGINASTNYFTMQGTVRIVGNTMLNFSSGNFSASGIEFYSPNNSPSFLAQGTGTGNYIFSFCCFNGSNGTAYASFSSSVAQEFYMCNTYGGNGVQQFYVVNGGYLTFQQCGCWDSPSSVASLVENASTLNFIQGYINDSYDVENNSSVIFTGAQSATATGNSIFNLVDSGSSAVVMSTNIACYASSGYWVTGMGEVFYHCINPGLGSAKLIDPAVAQTGYPTLNGSISFDGGNTLYTNLTPAWNANQLSGYPINAASPSVYQVLASNGANWIPTTVSGYTYWQEVNNTIDTAVSMSIFTGYTSANPSDVVVYTLPSSANFGDVIEVQGNQTGLGWKILANPADATQTITIGKLTSSVSISGGYIASTYPSDCVRLKCIDTANNFEVFSSVGDITVF